MKVEDFGDHDSSPAPWPGPSGGRSAGPLAAALRSLLAHLAAVTEGSERPAPDEAEVWGDPDFLYLEATLPAAAEVELDMSVLDGRVFIRITR